MESYKTKTNLREGPTMETQKPNPVSSHGEGNSIGTGFSSSGLQTKFLQIPSFARDRKPLEALLCRSKKQWGLLCCSASLASTSLFLSQFAQSASSSQALLIYFSRSLLAPNRTSLHLQRFVVQISLANHTVFGQC